MMDATPKQFGQKLADILSGLRYHPTKFPLPWHILAIGDDGRVVVMASEGDPERLRFKTLTETPDGDIWAVPVSVTAVAANGQISACVTPARK